MNIKVNGEYLDFDGDIEVEKKIKLFEEISTTDGDVSFSFDIPWTPKNLKLLKYPFADVSSKLIYAGLDAEIINFGSVLYRGQLRVESSSERNKLIRCSFFGGNSNWFSKITGQLSDLDLSEFDETLNSTNIRDSWARTEGIKYPIIDAGVLERNGYIFKLEDFAAFMFVKTVFNKIFTNVGIKIQGELLDDPLFSNLLVGSNNLDAAGITSRTVYAGKQVTQTITTTESVVTFPVETDPFSDGDSDLWDGSGFTADVAMNVNLEVNINVSESDVQVIRVYVNSDVIYSKTFFTDGTISANIKGIKLSSGDVLQIRSEVTFGSDYDIDSGSIRITPTFVFFSFGGSSLPKWTQQQFVSNILAIFNVISAYDEFSSTVTFNLFEKIKDKPEIDISEYAQVEETNFERFVGNYSRNNLLTYNEADIEEIDDYNQKNSREYGTGNIQCNNEFLDSEGEMIESDFSASFSYVHPSIGMSIEKVNFNELEQVRSFDVTSVTDNSGIARVNLASGHGILQYDIIEIEDSTVADYNGIWMVETVNTTYVELVGMGFNGDADLTLNHHNIVRTQNDDTFLLVDTGPLALTDYLTNQDIIVNGGIVINGVVNADLTSVGFFNLLNLGLPIDQFFNSGLSFGLPNNPQSFQRTMIENYWRLFTSILNDPVMCMATGHLPLHIFMAIDFLSPVRISTKQTSNLYYGNRMSGYKHHNRPCEIELIKL